MKTALILIGLPASGKSTFRNRVVTLNNPFVYSTDDVIEEIAKENGSTYAETFSDEVVKLAVERANAGLAEAIEQDRDIIWDQTNLGMHKRMSALKAIPDEYFKLGYVFLPPSHPSDIETLMSRFKGREGKEIPESVLIDMMDRFQMPTITEGFDELKFFDPFSVDVWGFEEITYDIRKIFRHFTIMGKYVETWRAVNPVEEKNVA